MIGAFSGDIQILLYVEPESFAPCSAFYQALLERPPYYTWEEEDSDRGAKFHAGGGTICVLCQDHLSEIGPSTISLETADVDRVYEKVQRLPGVRILTAPMTRPYGTRCFQMQDPVRNILNVYCLGQDQSI